MTRAVVPDDAFRAAALERGMPAGAVGIVMGYFDASRRGEFGPVNGTLERLIGRKPQSVREVLAAATGA